jgi:hypothetical protein
MLSLCVLVTCPSVIGLPGNLTEAFVVFLSPSLTKSGDVVAGDTPRQRSDPQGRVKLAYVNPEQLKSCGKTSFEGSMTRGSAAFLVSERGLKRRASETLGTIRALSVLQAVP